MENNGSREPEGSLNLDLNEIMKIIRFWIETRKVGSVQFNFFKGGISSYKVEETRKLHKLE